jgi:hypothetical protein
MGTADLYCESAFDIIFFGGTFMVALQVILWIIALLSFLVGIFGFFME